MDPELRDTLARFERYFDQMEQQFAQSKQQADGIRVEPASLKDDNVSIRGELALVRLEMTERFISVNEQVRTLTRRMEQFEVRRPAILAR